MTTTTGLKLSERWFIVYNSRLHRHRCGMIMFLQGGNMNGRSRVTTFSCRLLFQNKFLGGITFFKSGDTKTTTNFRIFEISTL